MKIILVEALSLIGLTKSLGLHYHQKYHRHRNKSVGVWNNLSNAVMTIVFQLFYQIRVVTMTEDPKPEENL